MTPKQILQIVGICVAGLGLMALPLPRTIELAIINLFDIAAMTGAFARPGVILILVGLFCLAVAALLPARWQ